MGQFAGDPEIHLQTRTQCPAPCNLYGGKLILLLCICSFSQVLPQNWQLLKHSAEGAEPKRDWVALGALGLSMIRQIYCQFAELSTHTGGHFVTTSSGVQEVRTYRLYSLGAVSRTCPDFPSRLVRLIRCSALVGASLQA